MLNKKNDKLDYKKLNKILGIGSNILKILLITIIVVGVYVILMVLKELNVGSIILRILSILIPLFIGLLIAWIFNPFVNMLEKKGIRRIIGVIISYEILIVAILLIISALIPVIYDQIIEFTESLPTITSHIQTVMNNTFDKINTVSFIDGNAAKNKVYEIITNYGDKISNTLPTMVVSSTISILSGIITCIIGLLIGFFMLLGFNNIGDKILLIVPKKYHDNTKDLSIKINKALRGYVNGALFDASIIFVACSVAFALIGVKSPILFALFCALMNVIPYAGPYIGAIPALIVAFSQSFGIGIGASIAIVVIQMLEGNILSPIVMSKTTKLHPVTIIIGLLIFGHFFGIVGMLLSTPIIGVGKVIFEFINDKYHIFNGGDNNEKS